MAEKTIAVVGASHQRYKYGNKCVRAYRSAGWRVIPVNPAGGEIEGLPVARRLADVDAELDRVSVYLPPAKTLELVPEIAAKGAREVWLNPGAADAEVIAAARAAGLNVIDGCSIVDIGLSPAQFP
ncbi:MAG: CoA-binding protein [Acidobacteria bacterium]|nr:MAG: CoA-binding protein [Acidobacteriota bacterium]